MPEPTPVGQDELPRPRRWRWWPLVLALPFVVLTAWFVAARVGARDQVLAGVHVAGLPASGDDAQRLAARLASLETELASVPLMVRVAGRDFPLDPREIGFAVDEEASVRRALAEGRGGSVVAQFAWWLRRFGAPAEVELDLRVDEVELRRALDAIGERALSTPPFSGGIAHRGGGPVIDPPRDGDALDVARSTPLLLAALVRSEREPIELPLLKRQPTTEPSALDHALSEARRLLAANVELTSEDGEVTLSATPAELGAALRSVVTPDGRRVDLHFDPTAIAAWLASEKQRLEAPPRSAEFVIDAQERVSVLPSRPGTRISAERVAEALLLAAHSAGRHGVLPRLTGAEPEVTTDELLARGVTGLVSRFTTHHPCCQPRVKNIHRIADMLDGLLVLPGEIVSVNATIGPRTVKNGFVEAPTIEEGEMVDSLGGGVSQFATTFFNALFYGGYDIIERQPHSFYFARYPMGHEATLSWPKPDIIFRNDTAAAMLIRCVYTETSISVKIYGNNGGRKVRATRGAQFDVTRPPVELLPNPDLSPDEEKVKESGQIGWSVFVGRELTFPGGAKKDEKRKVVYKPRVRRVEVHPCRIPAGEPGHTGEKCPVPEAGTGEDGG